MCAERDRGGFEAKPRARARLKEQQRYRAPRELETRLAAAFKFVSKLTELIDIVDVKFARAQNVFEMAGLSRSYRPAGSLVEFCRAARRICTPYRNAFASPLTKG